MVSATYKSYTEGTGHMTLTKIQIIEAIQNKNGFTKKQAEESVEILLELINNPGGHSLQSTQTKI